MRDNNLGGGQKKYRNHAYPDPPDLYMSGGVVEGEEGGGGGAAQGRGVPQQHQQRETHPCSPACIVYSSDCNRYIDLCSYIYI